MTTTATPVERLLPDHRIADLRHRLSLSDELESEKPKVQEELMRRIEEDSMLPFYKGLCARYHIAQDAALVESLAKRNKEEEDRLDAAVTDAEENLGDVEVRDAMLEIAHHYCTIGDKDKAVEQYEKARAKTAGAGGRLDILLTLIRLSLFECDLTLCQKTIIQAKIELDKGGDWERRNKLKVYEALYLIHKRLLTESTNLLVDSLATFSSNELIDLDTFVFHTVVLSMLTLDRPSLRTKVMQCPEVIQSLAKDEVLNDFLRSICECNYRDFMRTLIPVWKKVRMDRYLGQHHRHFIRNMRLRSFRQYLEPYESVTLKAMSDAFGVSPDFIETELATFIGSGQLSCRIDKVSGVIASTRKDKRVALIGDVIKQGDGLLNQVQKLSRIVDM